jgi:hypothetical protein
MILGVDDDAGHEGYANGTLPGDEDEELDALDAAAVAALLVELGRRTAIPAPLTKCWAVAR